ncbi:hypothetical protein LguiB_011302 [Lonicera macranthoides]
MNRYYCYRDVLPFTALVAIECITVGGNTLYKEATSQGMNYYAFVVYTFLIGSLLLLPYPFFMYRRSVLPRISPFVVCKIMILGVVGYLAQMLGYVGIGYGSPTLSSVTSNLTPAFTFLLAIIFRMEKLNRRSSSSQAKIMGTLVSISGAIVVTLYNGPSILFTPQPSDSLHLHRSSQSNWIIGALLLTAQNLLLSIVYVFQAQIMKEYPVDLVVVLVYDFSGLVVSAIVGLIMERNLNAWKIKPGIVLTTMIYMGFFAGFFTGIVHTWGLRIKGPLYIALFKPLSIVIAVVMGVIFLGDTLHLGSIIGGAIISIGFYGVIWGKAKEEKGVESNSEGSESSSSSTQTTKMPLLQGHGQNV